MRGAASEVAHERSVQTGGRRAPGAGSASGAEPAGARRSTRRRPRRAGGAACSSGSRSSSLLAAAAVFAWQKFETLETPAERERASPGGPGRRRRRCASRRSSIGDMPITLDALGTVTPFETVTIRTQIAGTLMELGFTEGQMVKKGDFLAQIDPRPYQAALAQAQGQLAKDQALLAQAQSDLDRYEALSKQDSIAKQQVADQQALVAQDKAAIQTDQAQVQTAQLNLNYTRIVSPIDGRVGIRLVDPGNYLQPSDATGIVVVTQLDPISVIFSTAEDNLPRIAARLEFRRDHPGDRLQPRQCRQARRRDADRPTTARSTSPPARSRCAPPSTIRRAPFSRSSSSTFAC